METFTKNENVFCFEIFDELLHIVKSLPLTNIFSDVTNGRPLFQMFVTCHSVRHNIFNFTKSLQVNEKKTALYVVRCVVTCPSQI